MTKKLIYGVAAFGLILIIGVTGFFAPEAAFFLMDRAAEGITESFELDEVVLNYGTDPELCEKLELLRNDFVIYEFPLMEHSLTEDEVEETVSSYLNSVMEISDIGDFYYFPEPVGYLFGSGESLSVWRVFVVMEHVFEGIFIVDDQSGYILCFNLCDILFLGDKETVEEFELPEAEVFAEKLIETYGIPNCKYRNGYLYIPTSESASVKLDLVNNGGALIYNNVTY